ncbi:MAG: hypothetical protein H6881_08340 [Rhodobiaceae bacterium]|nr:hypothetical protein [Rhodobiaceae bacterium]MCC0051872.1 hypothetical protein [Rhodobiaceae bacterium]
MPTETNIEVRLKKELKDAALGWSIAWPNQPYSGSKPYLVAQIVRIDRRDDTHDGTLTISQGRMIVTVVSEKGKSTRTSNTMADQVAAVFPHGKRMTVTGGEIVIMKPPLIQDGFPQDADWRTPVIIDYQAS